MKQDFCNRTILIEIPSYHDMQLIPTIKSAVTQADNPDRLHFAVCIQDDDIRDYLTLKNTKNTSVIYLPLHKAKGACYARHLCQTLLQDEDYILHIDAHMRFYKHWDTALIEELESFNDKKAVLSAYPRSLNGEYLKLPFNHPIFDIPVDGTVNYCKSFREDGKNVVFSSRDFTELDEIPKKSVWTAGGFLFAHRDFDIEVPFDPHMYHLQDELSVSIRAFTYGFNIYNPTKHYVSHWYPEKSRDLPKGCVNYDEIARLRKLLRIEDNEHDLTGYDIGNIRTIKEFEECSGLYYSERKILKHCTAGFYFNKEKRDIMGNSMTKEMQEAFDDFRIQKTSVVNIFVVGETIEDTKRCIQTAIENAQDKHLLKFIAILSEKYKDGEKLNGVETIYVRENAKYGEYISAIDFSKYEDDAFCMFIDSDMKFTRPTRRTCWDEYYKWKLLSFGNKAVLSGYVRLDINNTATAAFNMNCTVFNRNKTKLLYKNNKKLIDEDTVEPLLRDGFVFTRAETLKTVKPDPNLLFSEHMSTYSARLYTYGYDIYYPSIMYLYRSKNLDYLDEIGDPSCNHEVVGYILNGTFPQHLLVSDDYQYNRGTERRVRRWLEMINFDYQTSDTINDKNNS